MLDLWRRISSRSASYSWSIASTASSPMPRTLWPRRRGAPTSRLPGLRAHGVRDGAVQQRPDRRLRQRALRPRLVARVVRERLAGERPRALLQRGEEALLGRGERLA